MAIQLSASSIASLKRDLLALFPLIRSSHLDQALARGLGYWTFAALQAKLKQSANGVVSAELNPRPVYERLVEFGYPVDPNGFEQAFVAAIPAARSASSPEQTGHVGLPLLAGSTNSAREMRVPLSAIFPAEDWSRQPSISRDVEGAYRRGYHQAAAAMAASLASGHLTAEHLKRWVEGPGMKWRKDGDLAYREFPPGL